MTSVCLIPHTVFHPFFSCIDKENLFNNQELLYLLSLLGVKIKTNICQHLSLLLQIIVAVEKKELPQLEKLYQRGLENGVKDLKILDSKQIKEVEPYCEVSIPSTEFLKLKFRSTRAYFFFILITSEHFLVQKCCLSDYEFFQIFFLILLSVFVIEYLMVKEKTMCCTLVNFF